MGTLVGVDLLESVGFGHRSVALGINPSRMEEVMDQSDVAPGSGISSLMAGFVAL